MAMRNSRGRGARAAPYERAGGGGGDDDGATVYVGNLPWDCAHPSFRSSHRPLLRPFRDPCNIHAVLFCVPTGDWKQLKDYMAEGGSVVRADVKTGEDGRSRGFGIVVYSSADEAEYAIANLNGCDLGGREIIVRLDNGGKGGGEGGGKGGGRGGGKGEGKGGKGGGKGKGKGGKGKGKGDKPRSKDDLDDDLDSYMGGKGESKDAPEATRSKKVEKVAASASNLDDDLDSYFAAKAAPTKEEE